MDKDDEERSMDFIGKQVEKAKQDTKEDESETSKTPLIHPKNDAPLILDIKLKPKPKLLPMLNIKQEKIKNQDIKDISVLNKLTDEKDEKRKICNNDQPNQSKFMKKFKSDNPPTI